MITTVRQRSTVATAMAKRGLRAAGYYGLRLRGTAFPGIAVLCYHGIFNGDRSNVPFEALHLTSAQFDAHCRAIAAHCSPVSLDEVIDAMENGRRLPPRPVLVTFDDGYRSVFTEALPILARHRIPATVFVATDPIERQELFWFDAAHPQLGDPGVRSMSQAPFEDWMAMVERTRTAAAANALLAPMSIEELRALSAHPLVEVGGHTASHPSLRLTPATAMQREIADNRAVLQRWLDRPIRAFAYPYGDPARDYSPEAVRAVQAAGYRCAFSTESAFAKSSGDRWQLPRFVMLNGIDEAELLHRLAHSWHQTA